MVRDDTPPDQIDHEGGIQKSISPVELIRMIEDEAGGLLTPKQVELANVVVGAMLEVEGPAIDYVELEGKVRKGLDRMNAADTEALEIANATRHCPPV